MRLEKRLEQWTENNLISEEQKNSIMEFENSHSKNYLALSVCILGVTILGLGIISLIAANWSDIPNSVKIALDIICLIALSISYYRLNEEKHPKISETLLYGLSIFYGASIALISQIFQLTADIRSGFLFWNLITFPFVLKNKTVFLPIIWLTTFVCSIVSLDIMREIYEYISKHIFVFGDIYNTLIAFLIVSYILLGISYIFHFVRKFFNSLFIIISEKYFSTLSFLSLYIGFFVLLFSFSKFNLVSLLIYGLITLGVIGYKLKRCSPNMIDKYILLIGIMFFAIYCRCFYSLFSTGIGLILSGIIIIFIGVKISKVVKNYIIKEKQND